MTEERPKERHKPLTDAALRALSEAEARRAEQSAREAELAKTREIDGRKGPDPVRYGDWETKGIASDFLPAWPKCMIAAGSAMLDLFVWNSNNAWLII